MNILLNEIVSKYYDQLQAMVNGFATKCVGGSKATLNFPSGKVTIELK